MIDTNRRALLGAGALLSVTGASANAAPPPGKTLEADLLKYVGFGEKRAGGSGDTACGDWLAGELEKSGYKVDRQSFSAPFFNANRAELTLDGATVPVYPQPIVMPTGPEGVSGPLVRIDSAGRFSGSLDGAIALLDLPSARWSSMLAAAVRGPINTAFAAGAKASAIRLIRAISPPGNDSRPRARSR
jgi:hypothetical protein